MLLKTISSMGPGERIGRKGPLCIACTLLGFGTGRGQARRVQPEVTWTLIAVQEGRLWQASWPVVVVAGFFCFKFLED